MADDIVGQKMSEYTPLAAGEKAYFMGDGKGSVVAVGKVASGGNDVNRLVELKDIVVTADWNETDPTKPGYIKNQPKFTVDSTEYVMKGIKVGTGLKLTVDTNGDVTIDTES